MQNLITDIPGLKVGHAGDAKLGSGSTVVMFDRPVTASVDVRGGGPGTRETALLDPAQTVDGIDAIVLSGGSAYGLDAASGVQAYLREQGREESAEGEAALEEATGVDIGGHPKSKPKAKTLGQALVQILLADLAMSLDNVLAVAGAAREHPYVLVGGLMLSITLTGLAASWIAKLLHRFRWIGFIGLAIIFYVALHMIWEGSRTVIIDLGKTSEYNAIMPDALDIPTAEIIARKGE